jgi:peptide/nickel transport system permease protein
MSEAIAPATPVTPSPRAMARARPRSWLAAIALRTFGRAGAKIGMVWLGAIAFCAVFGPVLASSHPILWKVDGQISSPMLRHLTPADVSLLILAPLAVVLLLLKRLGAGTRWLIFLGVTVVVVGLSIWLVRPPRIVVYEQYREAAAEGRVQWSIEALVPYSPNDRLNDQFDPRNPQPWAPGLQHPLGTDRNGQDLLSRMIHASRIALAVGFIAEGIALVIGVTIGGLMGYRAKTFDLIGMRLVEIFSAIPSLYLMLTFVAFFERNLYLIMVIIGLTSWPGFALFTRAEFLRLRNQDFVQAAIAAGIRTPSIIVKHMLPNGLAPVLVSLSFGVASAILAEATLSFLGLGLVEEPSWGQMLNQAVSAGGGFYWWLATFPGLVIFMTVFAYNLIGESLRDAVDPKTLMRQE